MVIMAGTKNINKTDSSPDSSFILESVWINLVKLGSIRDRMSATAACNSTFFTVWDPLDGPKWIPN